MFYTSTRNGSLHLPGEETVLRGISEDGGLFVPETVPALGGADFAELRRADYIGRAIRILERFFPGIPSGELADCVRGAYTGTFEGGHPAPLRELSAGRYVLELWHGPTCAFKDLALQLLPRLMTAAGRKAGGGMTQIILVATSGDTGKAALEGFRDVPGTRILVFYPEHGVSEMQKLQMRAQKGENVYVCGIEGNFDDAQNAVKRIFTDGRTVAALRERNMRFSSANSINWGRLAPQVVYYVSAYCDLLNAGADLSAGFNVAVPTGNFGNILAAYYAKRMGVPIARLICASNANRVLTDFLRTGVYNRVRDFYTTLSPSMDILVSGNLERMLYELGGRDDAYVSALQKDLAETGRFTVGGSVLDAFHELFYAGSCDDRGTLDCIRETWAGTGYAADTHTAVALRVASDYERETGDRRPMVVASTASPYKFAPAVLRALTGEEPAGGAFACIDALHRLTGVPVPEPLAALRGADARFRDVCRKEDIAETVLAHL